MNNLFMVIDYGTESNDEFIIYDLWDETNKKRINEVKISSEYVLSAGDKIIILDIENINNIIYKINIIDYKSTNDN